jgi:hypothetical protein
MTAREPDGDQCVDRGVGSYSPSFVIDASTPDGPVPAARITPGSARRGVTACPRADMPPPARASRGRTPVTERPRSGDASGWSREVAHDMIGVTFPFGATASRSTADRVLRAPLAGGWASERRA